jgi:hypothetical protein
MGLGVENMVKFGNKTKESQGKDDHQWNRQEQHASNRVTQGAERQTLAAPRTHFSRELYVFGATRTDFVLICIHLNLLARSFLHIQFHHFL